MISSGDRIAGMSRRSLVTHGMVGLPVLLAACAPTQVDLGHVIPPTYATGEAAAKEAALPASAPMLFMVTAPDCPPCREWKDKYKPVFEKSEARARLRFIMLNSFSLKQGSGVDSIWPAEYRWARDAARVDNRAPYLPLTKYSPLFVLARPNQYIRGATAIRGWTETIWPAIQRETGTA